MNEARKTTAQRQMERAEVKARAKVERALAEWLPLCKARDALDGDGERAAELFVMMGRAAGVTGIEEAAS